jgi:hypothetical protein
MRIDLISKNRFIYLRYCNLIGLRVPLHHLKSLNLSYIPHLFYNPDTNISLTQKDISSCNSLSAKRDVTINLNNEECFVLLLGIMTITRLVYKNIKWCTIVRHANILISLVIIICPITKQKTVSSLCIFTSENSQVSVSMKFSYQIHVFAIFLRYVNKQDKTAHSRLCDFLMIPDLGLKNSS